ncbi:MAG TPA: hypothetical protein VNH63_05335 [Gemmatimonadales bacterium]|nr:hypothetical protein [Gemmatimonadales bacterium]
MGFDLRAVLLLALAVLSAGPSVHRVVPAAISVHYSEGTVHGFLELRNAHDSLIAHGDLLQVPGDSAIQSRLVFHFSDSSVFQETVSFTQHGVFTMQSYHLEQSGPVFAQDLEVTLEHSGQYVVRTKSHKDGKENRYTGTLDLPPDVYNGMIITIAKNLSARRGATVHVVAFTPQPLIIPLAIVPSGTQRMQLGQHAETAVRFTLEPKLGVVLRFFAELKGQSPPDSHVWIISDEVPAFVRFQGPLYSGPVWRIDLTSPSWATK